MPPSLGSLALMAKLPSYERSEMIDKLRKREQTVLECLNKNMTVFKKETKYKTNRWHRASHDPAPAWVPKKALTPTDADGTLKDPMEE